MVNICKNIKKNAQITFPFEIWTSYMIPEKNFFKEFCFVTSTKQCWNE